ncbi:mobilization protein [Streptomyces sp. NPDC051162]|uniref:relaxase/mobilization nuclease domain-containing protein n=1 Tax=Streptomyces sp. NPDC051162 TaxID=3154747 RepID=UPI00341B8DCA
MIPKRAKPGSRTAGLLYYLWGPGRANEHIEPHMVAAWDDSIVTRRDPARSPDATVPALAYLLDAYVDAMDGNRPAQHVYHVPVRLDPGDRIISDVEWAEVAREIMDAAGIAPKDDPSRAARWVAMRHADDHIHIVATLGTPDGRVPNLRRDFVKMQERARELEKRMGLRQLKSGDKTAKTWPTISEIEKARRHGRTEPPRITLQRQARLAASAATSETDFFSRLARSGMRVQKRTAPDGTVTGYSVVLPGDRTAEGRAVWFSGSRLAPDLSLPRVRERWASGPVPAAAGTTQAEAWTAATDLIGRASAALAQAGDAEGAGIVAALGDLLVTYTAQAPLYVRDEIRAAAGAFERAGRAPVGDRTASEARRLLQTATQQLTAASMLAAGGGEAAAAIALLAALALAVIAAYTWHQARQFTMQAQAAQAAGQHLRSAEQMVHGAATAGGPARRGFTRTPRGKNTPADHTRTARTSSTARHEGTVRAALPALADAITGDEGWPALAATLDAVKAAGYEPAELLTEVAGVRELGTADSVAQVLTWRLQGRMHRDASGLTTEASTSSRPTASPRETRPSGPAPAHRPAPKLPPENPRRGPRR